MPELAAGTNRSLVALCLAVVWVLWGSVYLAIHVVIDEVAPFQAMAQRFLLAGLILSVIVVARRGPRAMRVTRSQGVSLVITGVLLLGLGNGLQALAQVKGLPSGVAALIAASVPAWAVLLRILAGERPAWLTVAGVGIGFAGLVMLVLLGRGLGETMPVAGVLLCVGSSLSWTVGSYLQGTVDLPGDILVVAACQQIVAFLCSAVLAGASGERVSLAYSARGWAALAFLVVACSIVAFLAFAWLLTHVPLSLTATHAYVNPVVALLLGWAILAEPVGLAVLVGGGLVLSSVALVVTAERAPRPGVEQVATQGEAS
ncbi:EamA domain-containing membrane protein RarD [Parafrankia irregularis]|uniref:EamA domain-containing membrane protein RarD n=1 Tax=Parafrankia irregularis TaxID=795642 RepID=A0A0S4QMG8_9ACTN|nr:MULTISPECIES: EamA family transporter [Parafrankia]MBE3200268.1 EamA family transporter [Parafrankia sp. CH37]CUU56532.1 EamA domain-containing membrane protein RarD [Parafrankia irregularis]